jgi:hypothetical protein
MRAKIFRPVLLLVAFHAGGEARSGEDPAIDPVWLAKAQGGIKAVLDRYDALAERLTEVSETRYKATQKGGADTYMGDHKRRDRVVRLGKNMILEQTRVLDAEPDHPEIRLSCDNGDYSFTLGKAKEASSYALIDYRPGARKLPLVRQGGGLHSGMFHSLKGSLSAVEKDPKYSLLSLRYDGAKGALEIRFRFDDRAEEEIWLDPAHDWRVLERIVETKSLKAQDTFTYGQAVSGLTFPTGSINRTTYKVADAPPNMEITTELISVGITEATEFDFRLSAFGLPEPPDMPGVSRPGSRSYLWIGLTAFSILCLGFVIRLYRKRLQGLQAKS